MKNPADIGAKWARNLGSAGQSIQQGVAAVQVNPAQQAAAQADVAKRNYNKAIDDGKWQAGLARTTLQGWQAAMVKKGIPRIAEGAAQAQSKMTAFMQQLLPAVEAAKASLPPRGDKAANRQRMVQFSEQMSTFKRSS